MRCPGFDTAPLSSSRKRTKEGYLLCRGTVAVADNVQPYLAKELKLKDVEPTKIIKVYRPKEAVAASAKGYDGVPITLEHPSMMVNSKTWHTVARGHAQGATAEDNGDIVADLLIKDEATIADIESGRRKELSAAYDFELTMGAGVSPRGEAYDAVATDYEPNHIAVVKRARGRTSDGRVCQVADSTEGETKMRKLVFDAAVLGSLTGLSLELEDSVATQVEDSIKFLVEQRNEAFDSRDKVLTEATEALEALKAEHKTALDSLQASIPELVKAQAADMASLLAGASTLGITVKVEGKDSDAIRREILTEASKDSTRKKVMDAMIPDLAKADGASLTLATNALFAMGSTAPAKKTAAHDSLGNALAGTAHKAAVASATSVGRSAMLQTGASAWKAAKK